jgi:hypothetical protein
MSDGSIDDAASQSDLIHERLQESPIKRWILLDGNRTVLIGLFSAFIFVSCGTIGSAGFIPVTDPDTATTLVAAIVGGTLPFITIVLAINQLVLSQELGWPDDLTRRFEGMTSFRRDVERVTDTSVSPAAPADFLQLIVETTVDRAQSLRTATTQVDDPEVGQFINQFVDAVTNEGETTSKALEDADFGTFDALSSVLGRFNGAHLYAARQLRTHHSETLSAEALAVLDSVIELLGQLAIARQTFKTLYTQHELASLSKRLLYVGFPTLLGGGIFMMTYSSIIATVDSRLGLVVLVSAVVTLAFLPFTVLIVYTFRIASIASRTADFGPFVPRVDIGQQ